MYMSNCCENNYFMDRTVLYYIISFTAKQTGSLFVKYSILICFKYRYSVIYHIVLKLLFFFC